MPDPANWGVADVVNYFKATGFEEQATAFQDQVGRLFDIHGQVMFKKQKTQACVSVQLTGNRWEVPAANDA